MNREIFFRIFLLLLLAVPLRAQKILLSFPDTTGIRGKLITVPVLVKTSLTGKNVTSYQLQIEFSDYVLSLDSVVATGTMTGTAGMSYVYRQPGINSVIIAAASTTPLQGDGALIKLRFRIVYSGYSALHFTNTAQNFLNEGTPADTLDDGSLTANEPAVITVSPNESILAVGETLPFSVYGGIPPYQWKTTDLALASMDTLGNLTALKTGSIRVIATDASGLVDTSNGAIEIRALRVSVPDTTVRAGQIIDLPFSVSSLTGLGITSGSIVMTYDTNSLAPTAMMLSGTILATYSNVVSHRTHPNILEIAFAGTVPLAGEGPLCRIRFSATRSGWSNMTFSGALFNESIVAKTRSGYIQVNSSSSLSLTPSTATIIVGDTLTFTSSSGTTPFTWSVSDSSVASINPSGRLIAKKNGIVHVTVRDNTGATGISGDITIYNAQIVLGEIWADRGMNIDLPIRIDRIDGGVSITSFEGAIDFDTSTVKPIGVTSTGTVSEGWSISSRIVGSRLTVAAAGVTGFQSPGVLFRIQVRTNPLMSINQTSSVQFASFLLNEGNPSSMTVNGSVRIISVPDQTVLVLPDNAASGLTPNVQFGWSPANWAQTYHLQVAQSNTFAAVVFQDSLLTTTTRLVTGLANGQYYWRVRAKNVAGIGLWSTTRSFAVGAVSVQTNTEQPQTFELRQNYPNPFNPTTVISYHLSASSQTRLSVYDLFGREVAVLVNEKKPAGRYEVTWNAFRFSSGVYFYKLEARHTSTGSVDGGQAGSFTSTKRLILLR